jgi:hypothetical protein
VSELAGTIAQRTSTTERSKGHRLQHGVTIEAPPELVWDFVSDFAGWSSWNPLYRKTRGDAVEGGTIGFAIELKGMRLRKARARVTRVRPNALLKFNISRLAGLLKVDHFVEIEELSPTRCRVTTGEVLAGPLAGMAMRTLASRLATGREAMNMALKDVAERKWRGQRAQTR